MTGRENVYLNGAILGMTRAEIVRKLPEIVEFSGIGEFLNVPVKRYSSGMYVRLAFSVAAHLEPDILLLDEVLAVGDLAFQRKCIDFAKDLRRRGATILFVSHNMFSIKTMCSRVIYLQNGRIRFDGPTDEGIALYEADCRLESVPWAQAEVGDAPIRVADVALTDEAGVPCSVFDRGQRLRLRMEFEASRAVEAPNVIVAVVRSDSVACSCFSTELDGVTVDVSSGRGVVELVMPPLLLVAGLYTVEILVRERGFQKLICAQLGRRSMCVTSSSTCTSACTTSPGFGPLAKRPRSRRSVRRRRRHDLAGRRRHRPLLRLWPLSTPVHAKRSAGDRPSDPGAHHRRRLQRWFGRSRPGDRGGGSPG